MAKTVPLGWPTPGWGPCCPLGRPGLAARGDQEKALGAGPLPLECRVSHVGDRRLPSRLRERHQDVLRQKLYKLKQEQGVESEPLFPILQQEPPSPGHR